MARDRDGIFGRDAELAAVRAAVREERGPAELLMVRGPAGIGRTAFLRALAENWRESEVDVVELPYRDGAEPWDLFGAQAAVHAARERFDRLGDLRLADAISRVSRLCTPETYRVERDRTALLIALARMFGGLRRTGPVALVIDDVDRVPRPELLLTAASHAFSLVVATCRDDGSAAGVPWWATQLADRLITLPALPDDCLGAVVSRRARLPLDDSVLPELRRALGSLRGNPATLVSTVDTLLSEGLLVEVQGRLCFREGAAVMLRADHDLLGRIRRFGEPGWNLTAVVASALRFTVDDLPALAAVTGYPIAAYGQTVDGLIAAGVLVCTAQGTLACRCPALARSVHALVGEHAVRHLHRLLAERSLAGDPATGLDTAVLADHLALAGASLPVTPRVTGLLVEEADRVAEADPYRMAHRYRAALRHAGPDGPGWPSLLSRTLRALVRGGCYPVLGGIVAEVVTDERAFGRLTAPCRAELAAAIALAATHTGRPVPPVVAAGLAGGPGDGALEAAARWFAGESTGEPEEFLRHFAPLLAPHPSARPGEPSPAVLHREEIAEAAALGDLVTVFALAFGPAYGAPAAGPPALYHRVVRGFAAGAWTDALSAARELELTGDAGVLPWRYARLFAAEICSARGHGKSAAKWAETASPGGPPTFLDGWVRAGMLAGEGNTRAAFTAGRSAYEQARALGGGAGREWLLIRLLSIATEGERADHADYVAREITRLHRDVDSRMTREAALLARGLVFGDAASAEAGVALVRRRGHVVDLGVACLFAGLVSERPEAWLGEAYAIAKRLDAVAPRARARKLMAEHGVPVPGSRAPRRMFSDTESRLIELIGEGRTNRRIAQDMRISVKTVENYLTRLFAKTGCRSRLDLAAASRRGNLTAIVA
ncbi:helix-turn-helix transcriptional regulator [Amycolatopsis samaneae]|uniref:LuxR family transcriptional regulator n=1 Tax=Amycolatopsis samaneae TaxID=664691 RepID=A0ABW5GSF5_9PSEU